MKHTEGEMRAAAAVSNSGRWRSVHGAKRSTRGIIQAAKRRAEKGEDHAD